MLALTARHVRRLKGAPRCTASLDTLAEHLCAGRLVRIEMSSQRRYMDRFIHAAHTHLGAHYRSLSHSRTYTHFLVVTAA